MWTFFSTKGCFVLSGVFATRNCKCKKNYKTDDLIFNVRWTETNAPKGHFNPKVPERAFYSRSKGNAPPGNRTRVARMGILHDTTTPAARIITPRYNIWQCYQYSVTQRAISHRSAITTLHNWNSRHHALTILYTSNSHNHNVIQLNFFYNFKQRKINLHRHAVVSIIQTYMYRLIESCLGV